MDITNNPYQVTGLERLVELDNDNQVVSRAALERIAREGGTAVAMASPYPVTLERLAIWLPTLQDKSLALAPLTAVVSRQRILAARLAKREKPHLVGQLPAGAV
jgi:polysaccharide deacetylase 2 family uncharacterized protein YibQ